MQAVEEKAGIPSAYWNDEAHRLSLLRELAVKYAVERADDWRRVSPAAVRRCRGGAALLQRYHGCWAAALQENLPDDREALERLAEEGVLGRRWSGRVEWENGARRKEFVATLCEKLGITSAEQWRSVTASDIRSHGGGAWLGFYGGSVTLAIQEILDGQRGGPALHQARPSVPREYWGEEQHLVAFIRTAEAALGIEEPRAWERVGWRQLKELPGGRSFLKNASLLHALRLTYPGQEWSEGQLTSPGKKASQYRMAVLVRCLFPGAPLVEDHRHAVLDNGKGGPLLELDVFLPERKLAL